MGESIILSTPLLWLLYGGAVGLCLFDRHYRASRGRLTIASCGLSILTMAITLLMGAGMEETLTMALVLLLLELEGWK